MLCDCGLMGRECTLSSRERMWNAHLFYKARLGLAAGLSLCTYTQRCVYGCIYLPAQVGNSWFEQRHTSPSLSQARFTHCKSSEWKLEWKNQRTIN